MSSDIVNSTNIVRADIRCINCLRFLYEETDLMVEMHEDETVYRATCTKYGVAAVGRKLVPEEFEPCSQCFEDDRWELA